jgi:hypothetical protein
MLESIIALYTKIQTTQWMSAVASSVVVASLAAVIRIIFSPRRGWVHSMGTFFGGVMVGTLVGYIVSDIGPLRDYSSAIVAAVSIGAREVVEWILERMQELKRIKFAYFLSDAKYNDYAKNQEKDSQMHDSIQPSILDSGPPSFLDRSRPSEFELSRFPDTDIDLDNWIDVHKDGKKNG